MRIIVTGANGFIGSYIISALFKSGHQPVVARRSSSKTHCQLGFETTSIDFGKKYSQLEWYDRLNGIDTVINCAGILRETHTQKFNEVHFEGPKSLLSACKANGVKKFIQISALGDPRDSAFIRSKYQFDDYLQTSDLDWTIIRPSVVYSPTGSFGGTSLLRALSILPWLIFVPGNGDQKLQPIDAEDLAQSVVGVLSIPQATGKIIYAVGPEIITLSDFLKHLRQWLTHTPVRIVNVPLNLVKAVSYIGEWLGRGPLGMTLFRMLQRGNIGAAKDVEILEQCTGIIPRTVKEVLSASPSQSQDRLHARLYFLGPLLRFGLALLWIGSGIVGFNLCADTTSQLSAQLSIPAGNISTLVYFASIVDLILGVMLLLRYQLVLTTTLMLIALVVYTLFIGIAVPGAWVEPFGGLLKNIPLMPALLAMMIMESRR